MNAASRMKNHFLTHIATGLTFIAAALPALAAGLPVLGNIAAGNATLNTVGSTLNVNTVSTRTIMNWNSFNISLGSQVNFNQPNAGSAVLNRVTGGQESQLLGTLNSNGSVFLVNPSGISLGTGAVLNTASITINTSSNTPSDANFLNGQTAGFSTPLAAGGNVVLNGTFTTIGDVNIASGGTVTAAFPGTAFLGFGSVTINTFTPTCLTCGRLGFDDPPSPSIPTVVSSVIVPSGNINIPSSSNLNVNSGQLSLASPINGAISRFN